MLDSGSGRYNFRTLANNNIQETSAAQVLQQNLRGILLPFTTPFRQDWSPNLDALGANLRAWNKTSIKGYVALGSTGERVHLNECEYREVIQVARAEVTSDRAFIVGVGQQSTKGTIDETKIAADEGADAVLVLTPYFYRPAISQETLVRHFTAVAEASPVPVLLYSMPVLTGITIQAETIAHLSTHSNIIGVKDSSADVAGFRKTVELVRNEAGVDFLVLTGNGTVLLDCLKAGAAGGILAVGCVAPELCVAIFDGFNHGESVENLQLILTPLARAVTTEYGIGGLKAAMDLAGYQGGLVRPPLQMPSETDRNRIAEVLKAGMQALKVPTTVP